MNTENEKLMILELGITEDGYEFASDIKTALNIAEADLDDITIRLEESVESLKKRYADCLTFFWLVNPESHR